MVPDFSPLIFFVWFSAFGVGVAGGLFGVAIATAFVEVSTAAWLVIPLAVGAVAAVAFKAWLGD